MPQSKTITAAVPSAADVWEDVAVVTVPANVQMLQKILFSLSPDFGATGTNRAAPIFRIIGSGLLEQSPHEYIGPCADAVLGVSGAAVFQLNHLEYMVEAAVATGGTITVQVNTVDEAIAAGTIRAMLVFVEETAPSGNHQSQVVNAAMATTADLWAAVDTVTIPRMGEGNNPTRIKRIAIAGGPDQAALALLRMSLRIRLSGSGLGEGGDHEFLGPANGTMAATPGVLGYDNLVVFYDVDIPINAGGQIEVEQILDTETPTAGTVIVGFEYA